MYEQDADGLWWYRSKRQRTKCKQFVCLCCGEIFYRIPSTSRKFCSKICANKSNASAQSVTKAGSGNPMWKGGRKRDANGYVRIWQPSHPNADNKGCVFEHRLVVEDSIGRYLERFETVHHKNGICDDNRLENLQLMCSLHPQGQTPEDLVSWAKQILKLYGDSK
jgi:hypothetical protein